MIKKVSPQIQASGIRRDRKTATPSTEQLQQAVGVICKVIGQIPAFHVYSLFVSHRFADDESEVGLKAMIHNAALDSTLICLRCFNEFLKPNGWPDDIRARHFPGVFLEPFLAEGDETDIHKYLAHITFPRLDIVTKPWLVDHMVTLGLQQGIAFLTLVESGLELHSEAAVSELRGVREGARSLILRIAAQGDIDRA